ncbi:molecular chaperone [Synechococcus sp. PCC 7502]|uniref:Hsp70 family protein n=1 Tax=Synechococcus sp. PCC 7502 TaxID=1173263 RepID=UPI0002A0003E|nr:Hsp70 family protein [Synechococcus sp. PCC 7502]AFY73787.1 molecular chaperone [Synechococcus sp. PCC 7502]
MTTIAIDFGTSNTVVCIQDPITDSPITLKFPSISRILGNINVIPSLVFVAESGEIMIGEQVRSQRLGFVQPQRLFQGFKRELVAEFRSPPLELDGTIYTAEAIATKFIETLWQQVLSQYQPTQVIFTAPVGAFESYLGWFRSLATSLELPAMRIVDESTAAALGYAVSSSASSMQSSPSALVLVIDFGGGTLDLSLVRTAKTDDQQTTLKAEVIAKADAYIGGIDIDLWLAEYFLAQLGKPREQVDGTGWLNLLEIAESMKIRVSTLGQVRESWFDDQNFFAYELQLTATDLAEILESRQLIEQVRQSLDEVLAIAYGKGVSKLEIQQVLMVGGSSQIRAVQDLVISYFGKSRVKLDRPLEAIGYGALAVGKFEAIQDYLHHGYGIRLWDNFTKSHYYYTLFERGTKHPCERSQPLILQGANNGQTEIRLEIGELADTAELELTYDAQGRMTSTRLQKHSDFRVLNYAQSLIKSLVKSDRSHVSLKLNPPAEMGIDRLEIKLAVNSQRILIGTVTDLLTQKVLMQAQPIAHLD